MKVKTVIASAFAFAAIAIPAAAMADTTYDTTYAWGGGAISAWGGGATSTYGETFYAPADNEVLKDVTFYVSGAQGSSVNYYAQVYAWSGSLFGGSGNGMAIGAPVYSTALTNYTASGGWDAITFNPNAAVTPGMAYVALLTVPYVDGSTAFSFGANLYTHNAGDGGGGFNFYNNNGDITALNTSVWDNFADFGDLAYTAHFQSVPEPAQYAVLGLGVLGLLVRRRKA